MSKKLKTGIGFLTLLGGWIVVAPLLANYLVVQKPLERADAIVILSGSAEYIERTREAAEIFTKEISSKIILTDDGLSGGWNNELNRNPSWAERARWELIALGVREDAVEVLPTIVQGTNEEAELIVKTAAKRGIKSVMLVTSAYHSRRTIWSFEKAAERKNLTLTIGVLSPPGKPNPFWWLSVNGWTTIGLEWMKTVYYRICH
jgi:uncharacterized SAM-binding protein YcdF (DUF218 family)